MLRKVALVTGSTAGIGVAIARRLAAAGHSLVLTGLGDQKDIFKLLVDFKTSYHDRINFVPGDLTKKDKVIDMCKTITDIHSNGVDILVNNAGWGRIVNMSSMNGVVSQPGKVPYCTTKAGIIGMTKTIALETAEYGITCNAVCPGFVETEIAIQQIKALANRKNLSYEDAKKEFFENIHPTKQPVTADQISSLVSYLCTDDAASITGASLLMDGGNTAR